MTMFVRKGSKLFSERKENLIIENSLPNNVFCLKVDEYNVLYLEEMEPFVIPDKLYFDIEKYTNRIIQSVNDRNSNTGVLLSGEKGSGKSLLAKNISVKLGYPTIIVNRSFEHIQFNSFIQSIQENAIILFDEFEKTFDWDDQAEMLSLLDGMYTGKKLFIFTVNEMHALNNALINRPGRIYYHIRFKDLDTESIKQYCETNVRNRDYIESIVDLASNELGFNFDMLKALVEETNRFNMPPVELIKELNMSASCRMRYSIKILTAGYTCRTDIVYVDPALDIIDIFVTDPQDKPMKINLSPYDIIRKNKTTTMYSKVNLDFELSILPDKDEDK